MKAMWAGFAAIVVVAGIAAVVLTSVDYSSTERYSTANVRVQ